MHAALASHPVRELLTQCELVAADRDLGTVFGTMGAAVRAAVRVSRVTGCDDLAVLIVGERRWSIDFVRALTPDQRAALECVVAAPGRVTRTAA